MSVGRLFQPLQPKQLKAIESHKYACSGTSLFESPFQKFWCWFVNYIPLSVAPNTLTLTGLLLNIICILMILMYSSDLKSEIPRWLLVCGAISLFIYQTLDAIDGKQARRTLSASPLGELFDHGCDAVSTVFIQFGLCSAVGLGEFPIVVFLQFFLFISLFYMAHWNCYITGVLEFGKIDVTEGQIGVIFTFLVSALLGVDFWSTRVPIVRIPFKFIPFFVILASASANIYRFVSTLLSGGAGKSGATVANTSVLFPILPFGIVIFSATSVAFRSPSNIYYNHPILFLFTFGFVATKIIIKLVINHMSKSEMKFLDESFLVPFILMANLYFKSPLSERFLLWICLILSTFFLLSYATSVCLQLASHLNIYIFRVDKPPPKPASNSAKIPGVKRSNWSR